MNKKYDLLKSFGFGALAVSVSACSGGDKTKKNDIPESPNIIYIMADDLGYGDLGCYGQQKIRTPFLDKMAGEGILFTQHYSGSTVSAPSRCCLMTGLHSGHAVVRGNKAVQPEGQFPMPQNTVTVARLLQQSGYKTGLIGKWGLGAPGSVSDPNNSGFDFFYGYNCQRHAHFYYPDYLWKNNERILLPENKDGKRSTFTHDLLAEQTLNFIKDNKDNPFFLYLPFTIPHAELLVPEESMKEYSDFPEKEYIGSHYSSQTKPKAAYAGMVTRLDRDIGKIFDLLKELGIDENTIVIFTSDNGPHQEGGNDPDFFESTAGLRGIKRALYEGGIRVPMIVRWPGVIEAGITSNHISAFWDFMPTACELGGIEAPAGIDGISYLPELLGKKQKQHDYLYWEFHEQGNKQAIRKGKWKAVKLKMKNNYDVPIELYNLDNDPGENTNIASQYPELISEMKILFKEAHKSDINWPLFNTEFNQ
ncbi:arylsulfatase [Bacteroidota bacterium]